MKKKKILIFTPSFFPNIGGVEKHVLETSLILKRNKFDITIITAKSENSSKKELRSFLKINRFSYPKIKFFGLLVIWWNIFRKYYHLIREADIVHIHDVFVWYLPFRFIFFRKPVVTTFHGWEGVFPVPVKNKLWRKLGVFLSTKTIAVGKYLEKYYDFSSDVVIYGGVHVPRQVFTKENILLYVGRLEYDTGLPLLLQSLKQEPWNGKVVFCGDGVLREQAELVGEVTGFRNPIPFLKKAKIVFAGGYLSVLEAFAYKCIVLAAYNNPLKRDYFSLSPFGHIVNVVKNKKELSKKIQFLKKNTKFSSNQIEEGFSFVKKQSWQSIAKIYLELYKSVQE